MKQLYLALMIMFTLNLTVKGQTNYWTEEFTTPEGWTLEDNWTIDGGLLEFSWDPTIYNFDQHAVSPFITLDEHVTELSVRQSLLIYNPTENENAQIVISTFADDYVLWDYSLINGNWGNSSGTDTTFSLEQFAGETIQIKLRTFGETTFNWSSWQVFDIKIMASYTHDLMVTNIQGPKNTELFQPADWVVEVSNKGSEPISGYTVNLLDAKTGNVVDDFYVTSSIEPGENMVYGLSWTPDAAYNTIMYGQVVTTEDQYLPNNLSRGMFLRIEPEVEYSILVWDNDNGIQSIICPENGDLIAPITGLTRALDDAGLEYELYSYLPENLDDYTMVIATLGNYCLS